MKVKTVIQVENLRKSYAKKEAVKGISFSVEQGTFFAFLGTNGAGKSTTIEILCTLLKKSSGVVTINGHTLDNSSSNAEIRKSIGVVFQQSLLDERLTVYENLMHRGKMYGLSKIQLLENYQFVLNYLNLKDIEKQKYGTLSGGQKRRVDIAKALIHRPTILFLDEPTTGLDPQTRQFVWQTIKQLQEQTNMTVFLTTHYMEEAAMAHKVIVLKQGEIVAEGTPDALKVKYAYDQLAISFHEFSDGMTWLRENSISYIEKQGIFTIRVQSTLDALALLNRLEPLIASFEVIKGTMDDVFVRIMEQEEPYNGSAIKPSWT
ncbi:ABC transporter ATP-binding protein [Metasolibacillus sp. FSL H7-0170]|uniref:ABC transporter ATP-binding protein n=1 Tax=Metasolibacillus TaxID=2703677 RepID=UPI0019112612|nr:ABC transporter ATP-binding protein [Metasolibacillus fluoroglycofenilyticus]